jgi:hypothetical protein
MGNATTLASLCTQVEYLAELSLPLPARYIKALLAMMLPPLFLLLFGGEDNAHFTNANSSPTALVHAICRALKARTLSDWPLPAGLVGSKDGKGNSGDNNGNASGSGRELDCALDWDGPPLPPLAAAQ